RAALARRAGIRDAIANPAALNWASAVDAQRRVVSAWLDLADGRAADAVTAMQAAADLEDSTEKRPVTPGAVLPARELLGDMLLETHRPADALKAYETPLPAPPGRFTSRGGAFQAAPAGGKSAAAGSYARALLSLAKDGDADRPELAHARRALAGKPR